MNSLHTNFERLSNAQSEFNDYVHLWYTHVDKVALVWYTVWVVSLRVGTPLLAAALGRGSGRLNGRSSLPTNHGNGWVFNTHSSEARTNWEIHLIISCHVYHYANKYKGTRQAVVNLGHKIFACCSAGN